MVVTTDHGGIDYTHEVTQTSIEGDDARIHMVVTVAVGMSHLTLVCKVIAFVVRPAVMCLALYRTVVRRIVPTF